MQIVEKLKHLVAGERKITAEIISLISEVEQKKIFAQLGYSSLFGFLTEHIGYSAASAQRRIEASRLLNQIPGIKDDLKSGALNLSQVSLVAHCVKQKQKEMPTIEIKSSDKKYLLEQIKNQSIESSQKIISKTLDLEIKANEKKSVQQDESVRLELTLSKEQMDAVSKVKALISHIKPSATIAEVIEHLAKEFISRRDPARKVKGEVDNEQSAEMCSKQVKPTSVTEVVFEQSKITTKMKSIHVDNKSTSVTEVEDRRRPIPIQTKRFVWRRDHGKCQHKIPAMNKVCGSQHLLEIDHIKRVREGGDNHPSNLRLLCHAHNHLRG